MMSAYSEHDPSLVPQAVEDLTISDSEKMTNTRVKFTINWQGPSDRNGSFRYSLLFEAKQLDPYPAARGTETGLQNRTLGGDASSFLFDNSLPFANYTITLTAVNIKLNKPGPSVVMEERTTAIGKYS